MPAELTARTQAIAKVNGRRDARSIASQDVRWCFLIAVLILLIYGPVVRYHFVNFDDDVHVYENPMVRQGLTGTSFAWDFGIHGPSQWHPLAWISHQLDWMLYGSFAGGHHATNVLLHLLGSCLLYFAVREMLRRVEPAAWISLMFAVHPLNLESVAWVSERRNVLCGVFWMLSWMTYIRYARQPTWTRYGVVTLWVALALMSKPLAVTLPCVFLLLDYWPLRRIDLTDHWQPTVPAAVPSVAKRSILFLVAEKLPWMLFSGGACWLSYLCQEKIQVVSSVSALPVGLRLQNAVAAYGLYVRRFLLPTDLAVFYPHPAWHSAHPQQALLFPSLIGGLILLTLTVLSVMRIRRSPQLIIGWCWFLGTLVPMIGIVQVGQQQLADRYAYIPMIGLGLMTMSHSSQRNWIRRLRVLGIVVWIGFSVWQVRFWSDSKSLFARAIAVTERNSWAHLNLGLALAAEHRYDEAIANYHHAIQIDPNYALAYYNLGVVWHDLNQPQRAVPLYERSLQLNDRQVDAWIRLGGAAGQLGDLPRAKSSFQQAVSLDEKSAQARYNLGLVLQGLGDEAASLTELERSVQLDPENIQFRTGYMLALRQAGQAESANRQAQEVLRRDPNSKPARRQLAPPANR